MPDFEITSPDGKKFTVTGPDGATPEQALQRVQTQFTSAPVSQSPARRTAEGYPYIQKGDIPEDPQGQWPKMAGGMWPKPPGPPQQVGPKSIMEPSLTDRFTGQHYPEGSYLADSGELVNKNFKPIPIERRPDVLPITRTPEGEADMAIPGMLDVMGNQIARPGGVAAKVALGPIIKNTMQGLEKLFSPETVDVNAKAATAAIRQAQGQAARTTAQAETALEGGWKKVSGMPEADRMNFIDYVEGRSGKYAGMQLKDPQLQDMANTMRGIFDQRMQKIQNLPSTQQAQFIEDYFPHFWQDPQAAKQAVAAGSGGVGKQGSGASLKKRSVPTYADGIAMGLKPLDSDPIANTLRYVTSMDKFIAQVEVMDAAKNAGVIKWAKPKVMGASGKPDSFKTPPGYTALKGRGATRGDGATAYAPEGWARVYNNFASRGVHEMSEDIGKGWDVMQRGSNAITALELGLSGYHMATMMQEGVVNGVAKAVKNMRTGHPVTAAKDFGKAFAAPVTRVVEGKKAQNIYLGLTQGTKENREMVDLLTEAGARMKGTKHAQDYQFSKGGSYWTAMKRGQLKLQTAADWKDVKDAPISLNTALVAAKHIGRTIDTVAQPIFEKYIPLLKNGAAMDNLAEWMKAHPNAPRDEQVKAARQIWDSIDNRFGELVQDNIFVNKVMKQVAMLSLRSWSWTVGGDIRELGGGIRDFAKAPFKRPTGTGPNEGRWTQKMDYVIALPITYGTLSAIYQALKTGEAPADVQDLLAPRTGGTDPATGQPERLMMPGYMKDVFGFYKHPVQEAGAKIATAPTKFKEIVTNKDWRNDPIFGPEKGDESTAPPWLKQFWNYTLASFGPITAREIAKGKKTGSNLNAFEQALGVRTAPRYLTDPEGNDKMMRGMQQRDMIRKKIHDKRQQKLYE